jgi:hypothetical protein
MPTCRTCDDLETESGLEPIEPFQKADRESDCLSQPHAPCCDDHSAHLDTKEGIGLTALIDST